MTIIVKSTQNQYQIQIVICNLCNNNLIHDMSVMFESRIRPLVGLEALVIFISTFLTKHWVDRCIGKGNNAKVHF